MNEVLDAPITGIGTGAKLALPAGLAFRSTRLPRNRWALSPASTGHRRTVSVEEIVDSYNLRFRMGLTPEQRAELIAFFNSL